MLRAIRRWLTGATPSRTRRLAVAGEKAAAAFLRRAGYRLIDRNLTLAQGEADLVCLTPDRRTLVIVEVKTRLDPAPDRPPELSIDARKRRKLLQVARAVARRKQWRDAPVRIDVIAIDWSTNGRREIRHHVGAVGAG